MWTAYSEAAASAACLTRPMRVETAARLPRLGVGILLFNLVVAAAQTVRRGARNGDALECVTADSRQSAYRRARTGTPENREKDQVVRVKILFQSHDLSPLPRRAKKQWLRRPAPKIRNGDFMTTVTLGSTGITVNRNELRRAAGAARFRRGGRGACCARRSRTASGFRHGPQLFGQRDEGIGLAL